MKKIAREQRALSRSAGAEEVAAVGGIGSIALRAVEGREGKL